jgi:hypothetical protein
VRRFGRPTTPKRATASASQRPPGSVRKLANARLAMLAVVNLAEELRHSIERENQIRACLALE